MAGAGADGGTGAAAAGGPLASIKKPSLESLRAIFEDYSKDREKGSRSSSEQKLTRLISMRQMFASSGFGVLLVPPELPRPPKMEPQDQRGRKRRRQ